eukprot:jgi/Tetstr1/448937/TSEL_036163.t1
MFPAGPDRLAPPARQQVQRRLSTHAAASEMAAVDSRAFRFAVDRGGTFTDVFAEVPTSDGGVEHRTLKLLSEDPDNYPDAPREGIRRILEMVTGIPHPRDQPLDTSRIRSIRMGTTVATNALLERKAGPLPALIPSTMAALAPAQTGERCALVITTGFKDLLHIGNQSRPDIFDLEVKCPENLYERVVEVRESVVLPLGEEPNKRAGKRPKLDAEAYPAGGKTVMSVTGEYVTVRQPPDMETLRADLAAVLAAGITSICIVLKHSAIFPDHERQVGELARSMGFTQVSMSSEIMPMVKMVPRGFTTAADAYLTPHIMRYLSTFQSGFDAGLAHVQLGFMQSDGGLSPLETFSGHKAGRCLTSDSPPRPRTYTHPTSTTNNSTMGPPCPAGGVVGYALTTRWEGVDPSSLQVIGFDMGGTSTDVSRFAGTYEHVFETTTAGVTIQAPQLDINTVAAGGGSRLFLRNGVFAVGPESAGAHPGPVCYRKNGHLAVTDANLLLGRIQPELFPKIFGPTEDQPLDVDGTRAAFEKLAADINDEAGRSGQPPKSLDEIAYGFLKVANEAMCRPIRAMTQMKGYDCAAHVLACFGGAGGQHACAIARTLGMSTVFVHRYSGILSAVGIGMSDVVAEAQGPAQSVVGENGMPEELRARLDKLEAEARAKLTSQGFTPSQIGAERFLNLRYDGTDVAVMVATPADGNFKSAFDAEYKREFGFVLENRRILADDVRVRATGRSLMYAGSEADTGVPGPMPEPSMVVSMYFEIGGRQQTPVYRLSTLAAGHELEGPALLIDDISTIVVEPACQAHITSRGDVRIAVGKSSLNKNNSLECDPIQLAIFSHRFMSIAEQMGRALQRTSISVNIKERLDFSCALFGPDGSLVSNAPHMPVHLGSMSQTVRAADAYYRSGPGASEGLAEGDVVVSNHPQLAGGSHLPDLTVVTPVFKGSEIVFYVASRAHHADIGGITPGSMPPHSKTLDEEGAAIVAFKLVRNGHFQEEGITELLMAPGKTDIPGNSGTRNLEDNLSDLKAQVAANTKGIQLVGDLIEEYSLSVVQAYMTHIQDNAEAAVRQMLCDFSLQVGMPEVGSVYAEDQMDDGTPIVLRVTIDRTRQTAVFDFTGTGPEVYGNCNTPPAVTFSAIIYCLRCMVTRDIPLNQGCLTPIDVIIPEGCILNPSVGSAVVGGNVLTSQRVTDVVLKAFSAAAASQGCMNNTTFGDDGLGYYETVAGGAGAGPTWEGRSGVHTHMTNTRITDPEILERRYPVVLRHFGLREGSGGAGQFRGGDGVVRELEFLRPMRVGILSERRACRPFGLKGGLPGKAGLNLLKKRDGRTISLGPKASFPVEAGDVFRIETPGAGGYGPPEGGEPAGEDVDMAALADFHKKQVGMQGIASHRQIDGTINRILQGND